MSAWAIMENDGGCQNLQNFFRKVEGYGRLGYSIGGTAPMGMPAEIRKLNKFSTIRCKNGNDFITDRLLETRAPIITMYND